jgi:hypothetical protein
MAKNGTSPTYSRSRSAVSSLAIETRHRATNFTPPEVGEYAFAGSILPEQGGLILAFAIQLDGPLKPGRKAANGEVSE